MSATASAARTAEASAKDAIGRDNEARAHATIAPATGRLAIALQVAAALLWIPQAGLIALAIGNIAAGAPASSSFLPAFGILLLGISRAFLDRAGTRIAFDDARAQLSALRERAARSIAGQSPIDTSRPPSGQIASALEIGRAHV